MPASANPQSHTQADGEETASSAGDAAAAGEADADGSVRGSAAASLGAARGSTGDLDAAQQGRGPPGAQPAEERQQRSVHRGSGSRSSSSVAAEGSATAPLLPPPRAVRRCLHQLLPCSWFSACDCWEYCWCVSGLMGAAYITSMLGSALSFYSF